MSTQLETSMTDPEEQSHHHSEADMITVGDLVLWHQMPFLSVRRLTQFSCPRWSMWDSNNVARIARARMLDDTHDWYFPIIARRHERVPRFLELFPVDVRTSLQVKNLWSSWSGIWHSSAPHASERALPLPPMTHLPHEWLRFSDPQHDVIASASGLLLIKGNSQACFWKRLLVCNPLTKECRELPGADCRLLGLRSWKNAYRTGVQANLVVNEAANSYQVILTFSHFVAVFTSTTPNWNFSRFLQERPWGRRVPSTRDMLFVTWEHICGSAHVGGRLYFADVISTTAPNDGMPPSRRPINAGTLRLFEVIPETGNWQVVQQYTLRKFHVPSLKYDVEDFPYDMDIIRYLEIVECMGGLYAVLPAKVHDRWLIGEPEQPHSFKSEALDCEDEFGRKLTFMPLCFYIMQLEGDGVDCGVLRIQVPLSCVDCEDRVLQLLAIADLQPVSYRNYFSCEARGSVIWVACEDYVLSFDVVSRESKTQILSPLFDRLGEYKLRFAYRPSLHMKP